MNINKQISSIEKWAKKWKYDNETIIINIFLNIIERVCDNHFLYDKTWNSFFHKKIYDFLLRYSTNELNEIATFYSEKTVNQKESGSFYTPKDVVNHIISGMSNKNKTNNPKIIDPTSGSGAFLEGVLNNWRDFFDKPTEVIKNVYANDINLFSLKVWKQKIWMWALLNGIDQKFARKYIEKNTTSLNALSLKGKYDIFIGNPPYFEIKKSNGYLYGNIYAEILVSTIQKNSKPTSVVGFIVPISFQTTQRMKKVRDIFCKKFNSYVISSFADRPSCIFPGIHQKLNIIQFWNQIPKVRKTTSYLQFKSHQRAELFKNIEYANNNSINLMLGNQIEKNIYSKITKKNKYVFQGEEKLYISQRITHWSKAFPYKQLSKEYLAFPCKTQKEAYVISALITSDIFFFFWAVTSDGWHNTKTTIKKFYIPVNSINDQNILLESKKLFKSLEKNKKEINTSQSKFSYIHRKSDKNIRNIDELFGVYYNLTKEELKYIQNYLKEIR